MSGPPPELETEGARASRSRRWLLLALTLLGISFLLPRWLSRRLPAEVSGRVPGAVLRLRSPSIGVREGRGAARPVAVSLPDDPCAHVDLGYGPTDELFFSAFLIDADDRVHRLFDDHAEVGVRTRPAGDEAALSVPRHRVRTGVRLLGVVASVPLPGDEVRAAWARRRAAGLELPGAWGLWTFVETASVAKDAGCPTPRGGLREAR